MDKPKNVFDLTFRPKGSLSAKELAESSRKSHAASRVVDRKKKEGTFSDINPVSAATRVRTTK